MEMFFFLKRIIKFQPCLRLKVKYRCTSEKFKVDTGFILGFIGFYWVLLGFTGFTGFYWVLLGFTGFYWVLLGFTGFYWVSP